MMKFTQSDIDHRKDKLLACNSSTHAANLIHQWVLDGRLTPKQAHDLHVMVYKHFDH